MPTQKIDPKVIFASNAPVIDKPPVFSDKTKGWDVARVNDGRPTIKEMNKVQQDTDLKILWLNENSVAPYDASIDYPDGAVAIKGGSFKQFASGAWVEFLDDFADKAEVSAAILTKADKTYVDGQLALKADKAEVNAGINKFYPTLAQANTDIANIAVNQPVNVSESQNFGLWDKATAGATSLTKSPYDPLTQSKEYTNTLVSIINDAWAADLASVEVDADGDIISYVKTNGSRFDENTAAKEAFAAYLESRFSEFTDNWAPNWLVSVEVDEDGDVISYIKNNGSRVDSTKYSGGSTNTATTSIKKLSQGILLAKSSKAFLDETVTIGSPQSTAITGYSKPWLYIDKPKCFRIFGGTASFPNELFPTAAAIKSRPPYTVGSGMNRGGFEFFTDAQSFVVNTIYNSEQSFYVYVDDVYAGVATGTSGQRNWWTLSFASRKVRKITLCQSTGSVNGLLGIYTSDIDRVFASKNKSNTRVVWQGDSYCEGAIVGPSLGWIDSYMHRISRKLGFDDAWNVAMGGTGILRKGAAGERPNYRERISDIIDAAPDLLIFNLSVNDSNQTPSALGAEITLYIQALRTALPNMWIIIHGVAAASLGPTQNVIDGEMACANAIATIDDPKIAFIPVSTDPQGSWIYGTGYGNAINGTGNSDLYIGYSGSTDGTHPNAVGYSYLTERLTDQITQQILKWSATA